jgi:hypothetical protein
LCWFSTDNKGIEHGFAERGGPQLVSTTAYSFFVAEKMRNQRALENCIRRVKCQQGVGIVLRQRFVPLVINAFDRR